MHVKVRSGGIDVAQEQLCLEWNREIHAGHSNIFTNVVPLKQPVGGWGVSDGEDVNDVLSGFRDSRDW